MLKRIFLFYYNGFRPINWGRSLCAIVLDRNFETAEGRAGHVLEQLTNAIYHD